MKKFAFQVTTSIIVCVLLVLLVIVIVNTLHSRTVLTKEFEEKMFYHTEAYAHELSVGFTKQQEMVDSMVNFVSNMFVVAEYENDEQVFQEKHEELDRIIKKITENNPGLAGAYFTFDTERAQGEDEIWYARVNNKIVKADYDEFEDMWTESNIVTDSSYYNAIEYGSVWSSIYTEPVLDAEVVSYVTAVYDKDDRFIGVAGVDLKVEDILKNVESIKTEEAGDAILTDSELDYITGNLPKEEYTEISEISSLVIEDKSNTGAIKYKKSSLNYILTFSELSNGWMFLMTQQENVILEPLNSIQFMVIVCAVIVLVLSIIFALYYSKSKIQPMIHEYEEKDIFIHAQARSAKLGEMLSNIAHQWKQPLNSMSINLTNLSDDYHDEHLDQARFDNYVSKLKDTIGNMSDTVDDFANFLKPDKKKEIFDINKEINHILGIAGPTLNKQSIRIIVQGEHINGYGYKNEFGQVIFNVVNNALDALVASDVKDKNIIITTESQGNDLCHVKIFDNGGSISDEMMASLFEPYFTTKESGDGTGLGLYMSKEIIEQNMDGKIDLYNINGGVECIISIPSTNPSKTS